MTTDEVIAQLAAGQDGLFTRTQARQAGVTDRMLDGRVARGAIVRVEPGVFRVAGAPRTWRQQVRSATLTERGFASHRTAAALDLLEGFRPGIVEVTTERWRRRPNRSVRVHETTSLPEADRSAIDGIPTIAVHRTLVDLAAILPLAKVDAAMGDACNRGITTPAAIWDCADRLESRGRPWIPPVRRLLIPKLEADHLGPNRFEQLLFQVLEAAGLPRPVPQVEIRDRDGSPIGRVDWLLPPKVIIECDSQRWHGSWHRRQSDIRRDRRLIALGYVVLRFTWDDVVNHPELVVRDVAAALLAVSA